MARSQNDEKKNKRRAQLEWLARIMSEPVGREYLYDFVFLHCGVHRSYLSHNLVQMAHLEGTRHVGTRLADELREASPDLYLQMLKEADHGSHAANRSDPGRSPNGNGADVDLDTGDGADPGLC